MIKLFDKVYCNSRYELYETINYNLNNNIKTFIVTANPETFMTFKDNKDLLRIFEDEQTMVVADSIGIKLAAKKYKKKIDKIAGIDIVVELFKMANEKGKSIYLFGAHDNVIKNLVKIVEKNYPNIKILGFSNGYVDEKRVFANIIKLKPDIIMVGLGIPKQEKIIYKYFNQFDKGIFIGVGGSFDVLSESKKRAPKIFLKLNLEWLYRIIKEPKRIKRFWNNNIKFVFEIFKC